MNIRNLAILAHVDAGKTTVTERILYLCGGVKSAGSVDAGTAHTDTLSVERARGISVKAAAASCTWKGTTLTLVDTPGHADFAAEVERSQQGRPHRRRPRPDACADPRSAGRAGGGGVGRTGADRGGVRK